MSLKPWQMKMLMALVGIIISLVMVEIGLRVMGIEYPLFYDYDPVLGTRLRPGVQGYFLGEGRGYVSINSDGLRDREHPVQHPPNTLRIAVLGDSYTEAMQVNADEAFWAVMARDLKGCDNLRGRKVEAINFGQSGFGTAQELLSYEHKARKYSPDVVLLAFTTGNDVADNSRILKRLDQDPYYVYRDHKLVLDDQHTRDNYAAREHSLFRRVIFGWGIDRLRVFQLINHAKDYFTKWWSLHHPGGVAHAASAGEEAGLSDSIYREPTSQAWRDAWKVTEGVLLRMQDEVARQGAQFFVVTMTSGAQVDPDPAKRLLFTRSLGVPDLFYTEHRLENFCRDHHIPILVLGPYFQKYATQHKVYLHGFGKTLGSGHWNKGGHRLAGQTIAQWLCPQLR